MVLFPVTLLDFLCTDRQVSSKKSSSLLELTSSFGFVSTKEKLVCSCKSIHHEKVVYISSHFWLWSYRTGLMYPSNASHAQLKYCVAAITGQIPDTLCAHQLITRASRPLISTSILFYTNLTWQPKARSFCDYMREQLCMVSLSLILPPFQGFLRMGKAYSTQHYFVTFLLP